MKFELRDHSKTRLLERGIDVEKVKETMRNPGETKQGYDGRLISRKSFEEGIIEVVYTKKTKSKAVIMTAYYAN
jgi:hypothetical protein